MRRGEGKKGQRKGGEDREGRRGESKLIVVAVKSRTNQSKKERTA